MHLSFLITAETKVLIFRYGRMTGRNKTLLPKKEDFCMTAEELESTPT